MKTLGELIEYVLRNRKGNAFKGEDERTIARNIVHASCDDALLYYLDKEDNICGIVIAVEDNKNKIMFIQNILTTNERAIVEFIKIFKQKWPAHTIMAHRKGKPMTYNTTKLINRLTPKEGK